jgi:UDP-N-acetylmuramate--alanine ligase
MQHFKKRIHLVGIGGAGMSGLAELLHHYGHRVTGSDRAASPATARLERMGIRIQAGHEPLLVKDADLLIYSSAVKPENPERVFAGEHGIAQLRRAEALGQLMRTFSTICIAGTHGKTTTTSLVGAILTEANLAPTILVGGTLLREKAPLVIGNGSIMVAEADEYDRSFLAMYPTMALITNIDTDHLDCFADLDDIKDAFVAFAARLPFYGELVCCIDDAGVRDILPRLTRSFVTYGGSPGADYSARSVVFGTAGVSFDAFHKGTKLGAVALAIPGVHNATNAIGALAAAMEMGVSFSSACTALGEFRGVKRRLEVVGCERNVTVIDDYAHHPREIAATLEAVRHGGYSRITAVFQPHLYTRTRDFMDDFAVSLSKADRVIVTAIYRAREEPIRGVTAEDIVEKIRRLGKTEAFYCLQAADIVPIVAATAIDGEAVVLMGAGDISDTARPLLEALRHG